MNNETQNSLSQRIYNFFAPPKFEDEEKNRLASLLYFITNLYAVIFGLLALIVVVNPGDGPTVNYTVLLSRVIPYFVVLIVVKIMVTRAYVMGAARFFVVIYWINAVIQVLLNGGVTGPNLIAFLVSVLIAGLFIGFRASAIVAVLSVVTSIGIVFIETRYALPVSMMTNSPINVLVSMSLNMIAVVGLLRMYLKQLTDTVKKLRDVNDELQQSGIKLEQHVRDRTRALTASVEVSRRISTILDSRRLVGEVVNELVDAFGYDHVHIYLFDLRRQNLVMAGGSGEAGSIMLARGHQIEYGKGLVGRAAQRNEPITVSDVSREPGWLPNPLLPNTCSEVALPISAGNEVLGVIDVQQNFVDGFSQADVDLLGSICSQMAIALQNALAYSASQRQTEREAFIAALNQKIQRATTIEDVLQVAVSQLGQTLGAERASVELRSPEAVKSSTLGTTHG